MEVREQIIKYIRVNKVSTTEVADCLGKTGVLPNVMPVNRGQFQVGKVKWVYAYNESNWDVHEQVRDTEKDDIVYIETFQCGDRAIVGELVSKYILLYRQAAAIVTNTKMRDAHRLIKEQYPIWCTGFSPVGCFNMKNSQPFDQAIIKDRMENVNGSIMVCDDSGVVIIPKEQITEDMLQKLIAIEEQEDIWFDCIDRRKWDTFDTVCLKKYKN
ncbi:RraA family protein [Roseburia hominis]|jgi:4-hydroxy-4-methyl-2-oxoglutarate aldolase|uniref:RraA family protein n=1 Tax=Roseburia hominis TaxID=301301 RepID=UPI002017F928|nr:RraA family protein [Roseburia hominis]MCL3783951.1 RraA family protein [Roseburia hominis]